MPIIHLGTDLAPDKTALTWANLGIECSITTIIIAIRGHMRLFPHPLPTMVVVDLRWDRKMKGRTITAEVGAVVVEATIIIVVSMEIVIPTEATIMTEEEEEVMDIQIGVAMATQVEVTTIKTILTEVEEAMEIITKTKDIKVTIIVAEAVEDILQEVNTANRMNRGRTVEEVIIHPIINVIKKQNITTKPCIFISGDILSNTLLGEQ